MTAEALLPYFGLVGTAASAAIASAVLVSLRRLHPRPWLLSWSWSWLLLAVHSLLSAAAYLASRTGVGAGPRLALASAAAFAGLAQLVLLLAGAREVGTDTTLSRRRLSALLGIAAVLSVVLSLPGAFQPSAGFLRYAFRFGVRSLVAGLGFLVAAELVRRGLRGRPPLGRRLVAGSLAVTGLHQLHYLVVGLGGFSSGTRDPLLPLLTSLDVLLAVVTVLGVVLLLVEDERNAAVAAAERLEHLAGHDPLTGLPNRHRLLERTSRALRRAARDGRAVAILTLDVDGFRLLNDSLGHALGDELLRRVGARCREALRETDTVARLSGDEFGFLLELRGPEEASMVVEKVRRAISLPFGLPGHEVHLTASGGYTLFPRHAQEAEELLAGAGVAATRARTAGRDTVLAFDPAMDGAARKTVALEAALRRALAEGELRLHYQPIVSAGSGRIEGFEALLRWESPDLGAVPPSDFIHLAEATGIIVPIGRWVLREACERAREWQNAGLPARVSVNLSAREFGQPDLYLAVRDTLSETGLPAPLLDLEITERVAMASPDASQFVLRELRTLGVGISVDDFGTGYSSLAYLRSLPIDTLKIDGSFVKAMTSDASSAAIVRSVIDLARALRLGTVAEGVETAEQLALLRQASCDRVQGWATGRAVPADEAVRLLLDERGAGGRRTAVA